MSFILSLLKRKRHVIDYVTCKHEFTSIIVLAQVRSTYEKSQFIFPGVSRELVDDVNASEIYITSHLDGYRGN